MNQGLILALILGPFSIALLCYGIYEFYKAYLNNKNNKFVKDRIGFLNRTYNYKENVNSIVECTIKIKETNRIGNLSAITLIEIAHGNVTMEQVLDAEGNKNIIVPRSRIVWPLVPMFENMRDLKNSECCDEYLSVDVLLEKIHQFGYNSLTESEKEFLNKNAQQ